MKEQNELADFINNTLNQVDKGVGEHRVDSTVKFEIAIAKKELAEGKIGVEVLSS
jgi:hypothetical protein